MLNHCTFKRPLFATGKPAKYIKVLSMLNTHGSTSRYKILEEVWGIRNAVYRKELYRGYMSSLFADMRRSGIADYSCKTHKWFITEKGKQLLESAKAEWGKRYADQYWN